MSLSGMVSWGIKTCSMPITDQNEKLLGGEREGGAEINSQQSCSEGLRTEAAAPSTPESGCGNQMLRSSHEGEGEQGAGICS